MPRLSLVLPRSGLLAGFGVLTWGGLAACTGSEPPAPVPFEQRPLDAEGLARAFPSDRVKDRAGWAKDLQEVYTRHSLPPTVGNTCAVVAILEQESGYEPDPAVPGIGDMVDEWVAEKQADMGKVGSWIFGSGVRAVLDTKPAGSTQTWYERLHGAKTERDVDLAFRDFLDAQRARAPKVLGAAEGVASIAGFDPEDLNPVTTAGCMQVQVGWAREHAKADGLDVDRVRDELYTRPGCLHYGVERLLDWEAGYTEPTYRFADFNAGFYASRNAAFQERVAALSGRPLSLDGDLLRWTDRGRPADEPSETLQAVLALFAAKGVDLTERRVRNDLAREKELGFEETQTWAEVARLATEAGVPVTYARLPELQLASIKLSKDRTTEWFATSVRRRYDRCLDRLGRPKS